MEKKKIFTFNFNTDNLKHFRNAINEKVNISLAKTHRAKNKAKYFAWDQLCTIMDRLDDTVEYINMMEIGNCKSERAAFDFYEFICNQYIVIECIRKAAQIFNVNTAVIENSQKIFGDVLQVGGTDALFFEYVRSLSAVHPIETSYSRYPYITARGAILHCCPFIVWTSIIGSYLNDDSDLHMHIYESKPGEQTLTIPLYIGQFKNYMQEWLDLIPTIIDAIHAYNDDVYDKLKNDVMKSYSSFSNNIEYIQYLKDEYEKRFGDWGNYIFDQYCVVLSAQISNPINIKKVEKYKNAIMYSLTFLHNSLQHMSDIGFENTGIEREEDQNRGSLFSVLAFPDFDKKDFGSFGYNLSKLGLLDENNYGIMNQTYARLLLEEMKDSINKYVVFTNKESNQETLALVYTALYLSALNNRCLLNRSIPNKVEYRERLLSKTKLKWLNSRKRVKRNYKIEEYLAKFINEDGSVDVVNLKDI